MISWKTTAQKQKEEKETHLGRRCWRARLTCVRMATLMLLSLASSMSAASWSGGIGAVMVFSLGSGGRPTVRCFWCASKSEQA